MKIVVKVLALLMLALFVLAVPVLAQEAEVTPEVSSTIIAPDDGGVIVVPPAEDGGGVVVVVQPAEADGVDIEIVLGIIAFAAFVLVLVFRGTPPAQVDAIVASQIQSKQADRAFMDRLEARYQQSNNLLLQTLTMLASSGLRIVAPMTGVKTDDAVGDFLEDLQNPGAPPPKPPVGQALNTDVTNGNAHLG